MSDYRSVCCRSWAPRLTLSPSSFRPQLQHRSSCKMVLKNRKALSVLSTISWPSLATMKTTSNTSAPPSPWLSARWIYTLIYSLRTSENPESTPENTQRVSKYPRRAFHTQIGCSAHTHKKKDELKWNRMWRENCLRVFRLSRRDGLEPFYKKCLNLWWNRFNTPRWRSALNNPARWLARALPSRTVNWTCSCRSTAKCSTITSRSASTSTSKMSRRKPSKD